MPDLREIILSPVSPTDPEAPAQRPVNFKAERAPREYDWEPTGWGLTKALAETDLLDKEWELYNV